MKKFNDLKVRTKILLLPVLFVIGTVILQVANFTMSKKLGNEVIFPKFGEQVLNASKLTLQSVVEVQATTLGELVKDATTTEEKISRIEKQTDPLRFFDDKSGYVFVYATDGTCINAPNNKKRNGQNFSHEKDNDGLLLITEMSKVAQAGGGFVKYFFEKPGKGVQPKISYATMIPGTDYFVGAGVYIDNVEAETAALQATIGKDQNRYNLYSLGIFFAVFIPVLLLAIFIAGAIARPVIATTDMIKDIAQGEGDLTKRLEVKSQDELGQLAMWFNTFVDKVHGIIGEVAATAQEVASAATQVAASAEEMSAGINQQVEQATQVSAAVEEMTATIIEVARKAADASAHSDNAGKRAQDGLGVVEKTIAGMNNIAKVVGESSVSIDELGKRGVQIGEIIGVINDIADQTNLLALNAAIEAARAGEHGRGFAVVADEVRKLADRTTNATDEVAQAIKAIQSETHTAVEKMGMGTKRVEEGVELARESGSSLTSIVDGTCQVASMIQSIAAAAEEQSATSEQIARNIDNITAITRQSSEGAAQAADAAAQLSSKSEMLQRIVGQFRI